MSNAKKKLTPNFVRQITCVVAAIPMCLGATAAAQSPSAPTAANNYPNQSLEIERLLQIRSMMDGEASSNPLYGRSASQPNVAIGQSVEQSAALSTLLAAPLPTASGSVPGRMSESRTLPSASASARSNTSNPLLSNSSWVQPGRVESSNRYLPPQFAGSAGGNPLRHSAAASNSSGISNPVNGYVQPASFQSTDPAVEERQASAQPAQFASQSAQPSQLNGLQKRNSQHSVVGTADQAGAPRTLAVESRVEARALPGSVSATQRRSMHRSLGDVISSPNLSNDLKSPEQQYSSASRISAAELDELKSTVQAASARTFSLSDAGSVELSSPEPELQLIGPGYSRDTQESSESNDSNEPDNSQQQAMAGQESEELPLEGIENLIDNLKASVASKSSDVPAFQPYQGDTATGPGADKGPLSAIEGAMQVEMNQPLKFDEPWLKLQPFDFAAYRDYLRKAHLEAGPSQTLQIAESQYHLCREEFDRSADILSTVDRSKLDRSQRWLLAWQQAQLAIGTDQARLLQASMEEMGTLQNTVSTLPFLTYCEAHLQRLEVEPNHSGSVKSLEQCLAEIDTATSENSELKHLLTYLKLQTHVDMGQEILSGPFKRSEDVANRWFAAASTQVEESLVIGQHFEVAKLDCLLKKMQAKAATRQMKDMVVDFAFLQTQLARLKAELPPEDSHWLDQRLAEINYDCAVACFHQEQYSEASKYLETVTQWFQVNSHSDRIWNQYCLARCYWLQGAIEDMQGKSLGAINAYESFMQTIPNHLTTQINADQGNQAERLGTVAVSLWKAGQKERATQLASASVTQMYSAIEQGFAVQARIERLEQNYALMQHQLAHPNSKQPAQNQQSARNAIATQNGQNSRTGQRSVSTPAGQRVPAQMASSSNMQRGSQAANGPSLPGNSNGNANQSSKDSTPVKSFFKNLFSSSRDGAGNQTVSPSTRPPSTRAPLTGANRLPAVNPAAGSIPIRNTPVQNTPAQNRLVQPPTKVPVVQGSAG